MLILSTTISYLVFSNKGNKTKTEYCVFKRITDSDTMNYYKENGKYISLYNYYDKKYSTQIVDTPKKASEISYVLFSELFNKDFMDKNVEFNIISRESLQILEI